MVLESILDPIRAEKKPYLMAVLGFVLTLLATLIGYRFFVSHASIIVVAFIAVGATPLMYRIIKYEEQKDLQDLPERILLEEHWKALKAFMYLFAGIALATTFLYIFLPLGAEIELFKAQHDTFSDISGVTGKVATSNVSANSLKSFSTIFFNNLTVLLIAVVFSFIYGAGAIFVLTWNATVIGVAMGYFIRHNLSIYAEHLGLTKVANYLGVITIGLTQYLIHGFFEILGFFVGALAGGIISVAVIRRDFATAKFEHIILDAADLLLIAVGLIFFAAILEVWVTPLVF
ncbi:stage II sporulation protein M [Candidatus Woesearchaeota archaeon]|nr:stage II sporulation protein M [Candidatus Woesearchaeota archaeon]